MTDPDPNHDPEDPRGVASPPDPHGDDHEHSGGGDGIDHRLRGERYPEGDDRDGEDGDSCARCGGNLNTSVPGRKYCWYCKQKGRADTHSADSDTKDIETWYIDRVAVAVVDEGGPWLATTTGKAALDVAVDNDGARPSERVKPTSQFDEEPPYPLSDPFDRLPDLLHLDEVAADEFLEALDAQVAESPQLYDENGDPIDTEFDPEALKTELGDPEERYWLLPGIVERVSRTLPEEVSTDDDSEHWAAAYPSEHERAMENYREEHGHYPFEEPTGTQESEPADPAAPQ